MHYTSSQFDYNGQDKIYTQDVAMLLYTRPGCPVYGRLENKACGITIDGAEFLFVGEDRDATGEDIYAWNFRATIGAVQKDSKFANAKVKIFNT